MGKNMAATDAAPQCVQAERKITGEAGIWVFVVGDMTVFGIFFIVFAYYYALDPELFIASQQLLNQNYAAINTVLLLSSSWFVVLAIHAVRKNLGRYAGWFFLMAFCCGAGFATVKFLEYGEKLSHGITLTTNDFFMYYYVYTALHFLHVSIGMLVLLYLWRRSHKEKFTAQDISIFESGGVYWHMVDLLWIVLFPLLYLIR